MNAKSKYSRIVTQYKNISDVKLPKTTETIIIFKRKDDKKIENITVTEYYITEEKCFTKSEYK